MAITLRNNKGSSLTYEELDLNFHNLFYSASVSNDGKQLTLHYTGSALQSAGGINIALNTYTGSSEVAGNINEFQYNLDDTNFAGASGLIYDSAKNGVGIGTTSLKTGEKFRVEGGNVVLDDSTFYIAQGSLSGSIAYGGTTRDMTIRNWHEDNNSDIIFFAGGYERLRIKGDGTITQNGADHNLGSNVLSGSIIFGSTHEDTYRTKLFTWDAGTPRIESNTTYNLLRGNERGVILEGAQTAQVIVGLQSSTGNEGFNIISAPPTSSQEPTYNRLVAHFGADGDVGIGTSTNPAGYQFTVKGSISGSAGLAIAGNSVISGSITSRSNLFVDQNSTLSGSVTINTVPTASTADNYNFLVHDSNKVMRQVNAAPIPVGGIIMWSGTIANIPSGWELCNGSNGTPDLRNKFIVGAHSDLSGEAKTSVEGSSTFTQTGGNISHGHGGSTQATTLSSNQIPAHTHTYKDSYFIEVHNPGVGSGGAIGGIDYVGPTQYKGSGDSDNDNTRVYWRNGTTNANSTNGASHDHNITANNHLPPYFALAYIMYTG